jgi:aspartate/methionine/tyrosine aminotransferase
VWGKSDLEVIARIAQEFDLVVIADEIYEKIIFDGKQHVSFASLPQMKERTITVNGFSKTFAMTGWRLGYAAAPRHYMNAMVTIHQHVATCAVSFAQKAAVGAFEGTKAEVAAMVSAYQSRRDVVFEQINALPNLSCLRSEGTFYAFVNIVKLKMTSHQAARYFLERVHVATVPGDAYGSAGEGYVRISFAVSDADLKEAFRRLWEFV